jgi:DNA-binding CsgD family transcriptional regulator
MFLLGLNERALMVHPTILARDAQFQALSGEAQESFEELGEAQLKTLHQNFLLANGGRLEPTPSGSSKVRTPTGKGSRSYDIDALRAKHPNIGASWDKAQEATLVALFKAGHKTKDIAEKMGRKSGGIRARLKLLGLIDKTAPKRPQGAKTKTVKQKTNKVNTYDETWRLVAEERSLDEIVSMRGLSRGTIMNHIEDGRDLREDIDISYLKDEIDKKKFARIAKAFESTEGTPDAGKLSPVKALVGDDISFDEIRLAKLFL